MQQHPPFGIADDIYADNDRLPILLVTEHGCDSILRFVVDRPSEVFNSEVIEDMMPVIVENT